MLVVDRGEPNGGCARTAQYVDQYGELTGVGQMPGDGRGGLDRA